MDGRSVSGRTARLGKRLGSGAGTGTADGAVNAVALLLPEGCETSTARTSPVAALTARSLATTLARAGRGHGLTTHVLHFRCRGWNGEAAHPAADAEWAVAEVVRRYGDVPVCLVGTGTGARAALLAAGHPAVNSVLGIAPWLPTGPDTTPPDPVKQLVGRRVLLVHGTNDARVSPDLSYRYAERAKKINRDTCRFEVHSDGHGLHQHRTELRSLTTDFVLGSLFHRGYSRPVQDAMAAPPPLGLRMPLAAGFGATLGK
ncbi:dienelactone hydrolase [Streptomyces niger]|uniref:dienelactone hydrolase n=1 Tax=Streptomyces niger TaxID=66373 RepID=UPI00069B5E4E|nr:dienelactone hydrolase [Streptomyces niger]